MRNALLTLATVAVSILLAAPTAMSAWEQTAAPDSSTFELYYSAPYLYAGMIHGAFRSSDQGDSWSAIGLEGIRVLAFEEVDGRLYAGTLRHGIYVSDDHGDNWARFGTDTVNVDLPLDTANVYSFARNGDDVFAGTDNGRIYISRNGGLTWTPKIICYYWDRIRSILFQGSRILVTTSFGTQISNDNGNSWLTLTGHRFSGPTEGMVESNGHLVGGIGSGLLMSSDNGATWIQTLGCPEISQIITLGSIILAGSQGGGGALVSFDGGMTWTTFNKGIVNSFVHGIAVSETYLFIGASNAGTQLDSAAVWRRPLSELEGIVACGDVNLSGRVDISDIVTIVNYIFGGGTIASAPNVADVDCSGILTVSDAVKMIRAMNSNYYIECRACSP